MISSYSPELVPAEGGRDEFFAMLRNAAAENLPHEWRDRMLRRGLKLHEARKGPTTATRWIDYAAQFETVRLHTGTCALRERHNFEVAICGFLPYNHTFEIRKWGNRPAQSLTLKKQKVRLHSTTCHILVLVSSHLCSYMPTSLVLWY